jgi:hypothetical protein
VRNLCLFVVAALALGSPGPARAQALPPDQLLGARSSWPWAPFNLAAAAMSIGGVPRSKGMASVQKPSSHLTRSSTPRSGSFGGKAVLTFATATSGTIRFKRVSAIPPAVDSPPFQNNTQTYDQVGQRLVVTFSIVFPDCTLPVFAVFDAA